MRLSSGLQPGSKSDRRPADEHLLNGSSTGRQPLVIFLDSVYVTRIYFVRTFEETSSSTFSVFRRSNARGQALGTVGEIVWSSVNEHFACGMYCRLYI